MVLERIPPIILDRRLARRSLRQCSPSNTADTPAQSLLEPSTRWDRRRLRCRLRWCDRTGADRDMNDFVLEVAIVGRRSWLDIIQAADQAAINKKVGPKIIASLRARTKKQRKKAWTTGRAANRNKYDRHPTSVAAAQLRSVGGSGTITPFRCRTGSRECCWATWVILKRFRMPSGDSITSE